MAVTRLTCRSCEAKLKVSAEPGSSVKCPRCGKSTRVPEPEPEDDFEVVDEEEEEPAPKKRSAAITPKNGKAPAAKSKRPRDEDEEEPEDDFEEVDDEEPAPKKRRDGITSKAKANSSAVGASKRSRAADDDEDEDEEEERPRKRGKKKEKAGSPALWIGVGGGGLVLVVAVVVIVLLLLLGKDKPAPGPGPIAGPPPMSKPRGYQSPQEVWDAFMAAHKSKDSKKLVECMSPESRREAAVELAYGGILFRSIAKSDPTGQIASQRKPTLDALDKHGLTADATKNVTPVLNLDPNQPPNLNDAQQRKNSLAGMIKDHEGLLADLFAAAYQEKFDPNSAVLDGATLKDVKIEGNTATGTLVKQVANLQQETPLHFAKTDDGWFIVPTKGKK